MSSTHSKQLYVKHVCLTEDYSIFNDFNETNHPHVLLSFQNKKQLKVVDRDDKKKELTLEFFAIILWQDERIKSFFPPHKDFIALPPLNREAGLHSLPPVWTPVLNIVIESKRELKYLHNPIVSRIKLKRAELINRLYKNISFSGDFPIVESAIKWSATVFCNFDFSKFPFDQNTCPFVFKFLDIDVLLDLSYWGLVRMKDTDGFKIEAKHSRTTKWNGYGWYFTDVMLDINIQRQAPKYVYQYYIQCITIVIASSFSFIIPLSAIPGRVALIVTQFLTLTNIFMNHMVCINVQINYCC